MIDPQDLKLNLIGLARSNRQVRHHIGAFRADVLYCNSGRSVQMGYAAAKLSRTPIVSHLHASYTKRYLYLYGVTSSDLVIHCADRIREEHEGKVKFRRSVALRNAIDEARFKTKFRQAANPVPVIGFAGSVSHLKGVDILVDAAKLLRDAGERFTLQIAGADDGTYSRRAAEMGVDVKFVGHLNREDVATFFSAIDLHVLPTRIDAMPLSILEAAFAGVPTLAPHIGGIPEALLGGRLGVTYQKNDAEELARQIRTMFASNWLEIERSKEIAALARQEFGLSNAATTLCGLLRSVVRREADG